jgi:hypothetical protein
MTLKAHYHMESKLTRQNEEKEDDEEKKKTSTNTRISKHMCSISL